MGKVSYYLIILMSHLFKRRIIKSGSEKIQMFKLAVVLKFGHIIEVFNLNEFFSKYSIR